MESIFWVSENQQHSLHIYPKFLVYDNVTFFELLMNLMERRGPVLCINDYPQNSDSPKLFMVLESPEQAEEVRQMILRIWYATPEEDESEVAEEDEETDQEVQRIGPTREEIRQAIRQEFRAMGEETRQEVLRCLWQTIDFTRRVTVSAWEWLKARRPPAPATGRPKEE